MKYNRIQFSTIRIACIITYEMAAIQRKPRWAPFDSCGIQNTACPAGIIIMKYQRMSWQMTLKDQERAL
jgi:hypothetical protein